MKSYGATARRILFVITTSDFGGAESLVELLATRLDLAAFEPSLCSLCPPGQIGLRLAEEGLEVATLGMDARARVSEVLVAPFLLARQIDRLEIDLVHAQLYRANVLSALAVRLSRRRPALIVAQHSLSSASPGPASLAARLTRPLADRIVAVSGAVRDRLAARGTRSDRLVLIPNGVDTERFRPREGSEIRRELGFGSEVLLVGAAGRLSPVKGLDFLLRALAQVHQAGVAVGAVIAGEGPEHGRLEALAAELGLSEHVRFLGFRRDLEAIYPALDVFVLSSIREASPMALLEAMACGTAVVASRVGGIPEILEDGRSGLLFERTSPAALAEVLERIAAEPELREELGRGARQHVEANFGLDAVVRRHEELYRSVLEEG